MNSQSQPASTALQPSSFGKDDRKVQKLAALLFRLKCFKDSRLLSPRLSLLDSLSLLLSLSLSHTLSLCHSFSASPSLSLCPHTHTHKVMHICTCTHITQSNTHVHVHGHTHLYALLEYNFCRHKNNVFIPHHDIAECT